MNDQRIPSRLAEIIQDFQFCEPREKLEMLLQYAQGLPPLPDWLEGRRQELDQVEECMTPVYVYAEAKDGHLYFHFDVPAQSPTVRGYAALMQEGLNGCSVDEILAIPADFFLSMGLEQALTHQRLNGIAAILAHMKRLALDQLAQPGIQEGAAGYS